MAIMRTMKKAARDGLLNQLAKVASMNEEEEDCDDDTSDCNRKKECDADRSDCTQQGKEHRQQQVDMSKYIRKDSIPCWGCDVE
jgi:hypothetical protein